MDYSVLLLTILRLCVLLMIGMWLTYKTSFTKEVRSFLIFVMINIALPAIILNGFFRVTIDDSLIRQIITLFLFSLGFNAIGLVVGWLFSKSIGLSPMKARETAFLSTFGNTGLIGIPLCASLFGAKGAVFAAVVDAGMSLMLWTVGILFIQGERKITPAHLKSMASAPNIAVFIGLGLTLFKVDPGYFIKDVTTTLAGVSSPLAMFYIGMLTMTIMKEKRKISVKLLCIPVSFKLLVYPLLGILALSLLPISADVKQVLVVEMGMPTVTTASIIFAFNHADEEYGVMQTLSTNLLVMATLPLIVIVSGMLF